MPEIVNPRIEDYLRKLYDDGEPVRLEMEELGRQKKFPIVGPLVGRLLHVLGPGAVRTWARGPGPPPTTSRARSGRAASCTAPSSPRRTSASPRDSSRGR